MCYISNDGLCEQRHQWDAGRQETNKNDEHEELFLKEPTRSAWTAEVAISSSNVSRALEFLEGGG